MVDDSPDRSSLSPQSAPPAHRPRRWWPWLLAGLSLAAAIFAARRRPRLLAGFALPLWVLCGLAGALYVPQVGIINPGEMSPTNSIEAAIWVALGGRGTLIGPVIGAALVNGAKSVFTVVMPEYWQLFLGLIFIAVTLFLPRGVTGLLRKGDK